MNLDKIMSVFSQLQLDTKMHFLKNLISQDIIILINFAGCFTLVNIQQFFNTFSINTSNIYLRILFIL